MSAPLTEEALWAAGVAARLRTLQASFADDDGGARQDYIAEELERELRAVTPARRRAHLQALAGRFPAGERAAVVPETAAPEPVGESPDTLVARLSEIAAQLPPETRHALAHQLQQAGFYLEIPTPVAGPATTSLGEVPEELQKKLSLDAHAALDPARVLRLIGILVDLAATLDQLVWNVWRNIGAKSVLRRETGAASDFRKIAGPYLVGDREVSTAQVSQVVDKTRQLIAGLIAAIGSTGETFARHYLSKFSPAAIKELADAESGFFIGPEQRCWRKYVELFEGVTGVTIESQISAALVKYTEDLVLGAGRSSTGGE